MTNLDLEQRTGGAAILVHVFLRDGQKSWSKFRGLFQAVYLGCYRDHRNHAPFPLPQAAFRAMQRAKVPIILPEPIRPAPETLKERIRARLPSRAVSIALTLLLEALLVYLLLTLSTTITRKQDGGLAVFDVAGPKNETPTEEKPEPEQKAADEKPQPARQPPTPQPPQPEPETPKPPTPIPPALIPMSRNQMAAANIAALPRAPAAPAARAFGPADSGGAPGDSAMVGNAPNGEPMYAASWYREPTRDELQGYLSTAQPGWGLIACRTVSEFRVEDCVGLDEYPASSGLNRAILAAAWQFRVRPPRVGGKLKVGEWVRIRIDYGVRQRQETRP